MPHADARHVGDAARTYYVAVSLAFYVAGNNPAWAAEAQAFVAWRVGVEAFLAELPAIEWPG